MLILEFYFRLQVFAAEKIGDLEKIVFYQFPPEVFFRVVVHGVVELVP
jgi:hypothetical protein